MQNFGFLGLGVSDIKKKGIKCIIQEKITLKNLKSSD